MTHPDRLFSRPIERAHVDAQNTQLLEQHVCCASAELPVILGQDAPFFGPKLERVMTNLHQQGGSFEGPASRSRTQAAWDHVLAKA